MNKFELMNKVGVSNLSASNKALLNELILRSNDEGVSHPSVERLCQVKGIKHEKNFKGADYYLPGLVTVTRRGRGGNLYTLNVPALEGLKEFEVVLKHTEDPALAGTKQEPLTPAVADKDPAPADLLPAPADLVPAPADLVPAVEGANSTQDNTRDSSRDNSVTPPPAAVEPVDEQWIREGEVDEPSLTTIKDGDALEEKDELELKLDEFQNDEKTYSSYDPNKYDFVRPRAREYYEEDGNWLSAVRKAYADYDALAVSA